MAIYFNENESKTIVLKNNNYPNTLNNNVATKDDVNALLAEIEFLNKEIASLKRKIRKSKKW